MNPGHLLHLLHLGCFASIIGLGIYGVFCVVLLYRQLRRRQFRREDQANDFIEQLRECFQEGDFEEAENLCTTPDNWYRALPLLAQTAIRRRQLSLPKVRQAIAARFTREVVTSLESLVANINVVVKCEPMLGLLGTVSGMIGAFSKIALIAHPSPQELMGDLSVALNATAMGLSAAIPLLLTTNYFQVRIRRLEDATFEQIQIVLEDMEEALREGKGQRRPA